jgi:penicillin-binding protein 2
VSDHGGIIVYAPAYNPEIAIAVYGEQAGHGSSMANIAKDILDAWFFNADIPGDVVTDENRVS